MPDNAPCTLQHLSDPVKVIKADTEGSIVASLPGFPELQDDQVGVVEVIFRWVKPDKKKHVQKGPSVKRYYELPRVQEG